MRRGCARQSRTLPIIICKRGGPTNPDVPAIVADGYQWAKYNRAQPTLLILYPKIDQLGRRCAIVSTNGLASPAMRAISVSCIFVDDSGSSNAICKLQMKVCARQICARSQFFAIMLAMVSFHFSALSRLSASPTCLRSETSLVRIRARIAPIFIGVNPWDGAGSGSE
ncbi:uncharacterized protein APUU_51145S [Aspergillus puulaauensis]|uniref:Uncharacterized protein n=1 Tax=Aspergillus puulaauensis TaxID=1220207 RepID=A0A7R7XT21_9EURO|nr:uncharacterized protein APUU_51145S [Aspergillus puulaauensis]BCS26433.1 hypothetical protein APUU_51145S [Aspergillus puulaauensis]